MFHTAKENSKARGRARRAGMELPDTETFTTRKYLNEYVDPNRRVKNDMGERHLSHETRDYRQRDFMLEFILAKFHISPAASERCSLIILLY